MARQRRRRDHVWNPHSRGTDISAVFVLFAAGPLLLPLIGAQIEVIAFATPLVARPTANNLHVTTPLTLGIALAMVGDCIVSAQAADLLQTSGLATALLWAGAAYFIAVAADFDRGAPERGETDSGGEIAVGR